MKRLIFSFCFALVSIFTGPVYSQSHNIRTSALIEPAPGSRAVIDITNPITFRFSNLGSFDEDSVLVLATVSDSSGEVYRDTIIIPFIAAGADLDTTFKPWMPVKYGQHTIRGIALLPTDEVRSDDTLSITVQVTNLYDAKAVALINPLANEIILPGSRWEPIAMFQAIGAVDIFEVNARVTIRRCADSVLVFQSDSLVPALNLSDGPVRFVFPSHQGNWDITRLLPGCYRLGAYVRYPSDGDHTNDTLWTTFSVGGSEVDAQAEQGSAALTCFPNPVPKVVAVSVHSVVAGPAELAIYDMLGNPIAVLHTGEMGVGDFRFAWDAERYPAGSYICRLRTVSGEESVVIHVVH